ncbi:hypothetical protein WJX84_004780 [Apatococcus fuscideae]|uniref:U-box domain-containing protein n=1 Tax=Apatococcus fuscideae TaxID=2026836 RepID=A0AAW1T723_9CHLO
MKKLNGKGRLFQGSGKIVFELDDQGIPIPPHEFICPLTHEVMSDPVVLLTGMTYDRHSIKNWIDLGHTTCPMTQKQLAWRMNNRVFAARNYSLRHLIDAWVAEHLPGKDPRTPLGEDCRDAVVLLQATTLHQPYSKIIIFVHERSRSCLEAHHVVMVVVNVLL